MYSTDKQMEINDIKWGLKGGSCYHGRSTCASTCEIYIVRLCQENISKAVTKDKYSG